MEMVERVARAICGTTGCIESIKAGGGVAPYCRTRCNGQNTDVMREYGDAARAAIEAAQVEEEEWHLNAAREICGTLAEIDSMRHGGGAFGGEVYRDGMCDDMPEVQRVVEILRDSARA